MRFISLAGERLGAPKNKLRSTVSTLVATAALLAVACLGAAQLNAQGCILARSPEQSGLPLAEGGTLQPGHYQLTVGERHQYSYQHYVGDVYQEYRAQAGNQVQNKINLITANVTYQWSPRISFEVDMPYLFATRKSQNSPIKYATSGIGDTIIGASSWIRNPQHAAKNNFSIGLGLLMPSGNDDVKNNANTNTTGTGAATDVTSAVDYSVQPGNGGWGMVMQWMGYQRISKDLTFYTDGDYIATQGGTNGVQKSATLSTTQPLNNYVAISDQYLFEGGLAFPVKQVKGLGATFSLRDEGVPADNLFPNSNDGWRRPGFAVTAGPGAQYNRHANLFNVGVYKAVHRDRTSSYPDQVYHTHGDAAFAQYVWLASWTHRF